MANIILPQVEILTPDNLNEDATILIEQDEEIKRFQIANLQTNINVYERETDDFNPDNVELPLEIKQGDILILTNSQNIKSAYYWYQDDWVACDGNVDASKVIMPFDITLAGSYTKVGNLSKDEKGVATFETKGKSVAATLQEILSKREQPKIETPPNISLTATSGSKEVGTKITPTWSAKFNPGIYTYGPATGVLVESWDIKDTEGNTATTSSGSFPEITVRDDMKYFITVKANYNQGVEAYDNLGNQSNPIVQIPEGSYSLNSGITSGFRPWFTYVGTEMNIIDGNFIRKNAVNRGASPASLNLSIKKGTKQIIVAIPKSNNKKLTAVNDIDGGMGLPVDEIKLKEIDIEGLNNYDAKPYNVWIKEVPEGLDATTYTLTIS